MLAVTLSGAMVVSAVSLSVSSVVVVSVGFVVVIVVSVKSRSENREKLNFKNSTFL